LVTSEPGDEKRKSLVRVNIELCRLGTLTGPEARALYTDLERARDALSRILDRADGKNA
jgi:hypothetical protein